MKIQKKIDYNSPVVLSFVFLSLISLLIGYATNKLSTVLLFCVYRSSLTDPLTYVRMFTHVLGHADFNHYIGNMTLFLVIGPMLEEKYGSKTLLKMMGITAFLTGLVFMIFFPDTSLCGASGIVFMMIILASVTGVKDGTVPLTLILVAVFYLGQQVLDGLLTPDNVSQLAHILGGVLGGVFGMVIAKPAYGK